MSIFAKLKRDREEAMRGVQPPATYPQPQPQPQSQPQPQQQYQPPQQAQPQPRQQSDLPQYPQPQPLQPSMLDRLTTKQIQEEMVEFDDKKTALFSNMIDNFIVQLRKEKQAEIVKLETERQKQRQKEKEMYEQRLQQIDIHIQEDLKRIEANPRYAQIREYETLSATFKKYLPDGGQRNENTPRVGSVPEYPGTPPGPELEYGYLERENPYEPNMSKLFRGSQQQ